LSSLAVLALDFLLTAMMFSNNWVWIEKWMRWTVVV
jgi:hypothetical protein